MAPPRRRWFGTFRRKLVFGLAALQAIMILALVVDLTARQQAVLLGHLKGSALYLAGELGQTAEPWLASQDLAGLQEMATGLARNPEVTYAMLLGVDGRVWAHTDPSRRGQFILDLPEERRAGRILDFGETMDAMVPCFQGGTHVGWARVGLRQAAAQAELRQVQRKAVLYGLAAILLGGFFSAWIGRALTAKLEAIRRVSAAMARGERDLTIPPLGRDEIGDLGADLNAMLATLKAREAEVLALNQDLELRVADRTAALAAAHEALVRDIAERRQAEEDLKASEQRFSSAFQASPDAILVTRIPDGPVLMVNEGFTRMTGFSSAEALGRSALELGILQPGPAQDRWRRELEETGQVLGLETVFHHRDGTAVLSQVSSRAFTWSGERVQLSICRDITRQRHMEELQRRLESELQQSRKLESLGSLAGGVAHDMNNVLAAIQVVTQSLAMAHGHEPGLAKSLGIIERASSRGKGLVMSLTNFARKDLREPEIVDLNDLVREEMDILRRTTLQKVRLAMDLEEPLPAIWGERGTLGSSLMNLCVNAVDAMPGGGSLTLRTRRAEGDLVELSVVDTGEGMTPAVVNRAMEPFFTTKPIGKGTGLGLSMVYATAKTHGGSVSIRSDVGVGTTVSILLPGIAQPPRPEEPEAAAIPANAFRRILLVDDDELIRESVPGLLEPLGCSVTTAPGGREALDLVETCPEFDLVILDLNMPDMNGAQVFRALRRIRPALPVLVATGHLDPDTEDILREGGRALTLAKPYTLEELGRKLGEF